MTTVPVDVLEAAVALLLLEAMLPPLPDVVALVDAMAVDVVLLPFVLDVELLVLVLDVAPLVAAPPAPLD
jgi:hypothetical protein